jgi:hypothetical protein
MKLNVYETMEQNFPLKVDVTTTKNLLRGVLEWTSEAGRNLNRLG